MTHFKQGRFLIAQRAVSQPDDKFRMMRKKLRQLAGEDGIDRLMNTHTLDGLIAPSNRPAWRINHVRGDAPPVSSALSAALAGYPAVTVPMAQLDGLPIGVTVWGRKQNDDIVISIAAALERVTGGFHRPRQ